MKEKYMLTPADDLSITPPEELQKNTLAKMAAASPTVSVKPGKKNSAKRILACAALVGAMFMLMGAGYRVFSYLAYVPGQGIVMQDTDRVYVLKTAADTDAYRIDAISMVPVQEGEHEGKWEVTMLTEFPDDFFCSEDGTPLSDLPITIQSADGNSCQLTYDTKYIDRARFSGYIESAAAGSWEITRWGSTCTVALIPASKLPYADYRYPVQSDIALICYPVSENSDILAMTIDCSPTNENLLYWLEKASSSYCSFMEVTVTDVNGNTYGRLKDVSGYSYTNGQSICFLDRPLEAPVASIRVENLVIRMSGELAETQITIPDEGKTVSLNNQPVADHHGLNITLQDIYADALPKKHNKNMLYDSFILHVVSESQLSPENSPEVQYSLSFRMADDPDKKAVSAIVAHTLSDIENSILRRTNEYILREDSLPIQFGEDVVVTLSDMMMQLICAWEIDFTAQEKVPRIPKEAIKYR